MATLKYRLNRKNSSGSYDTIHYETDSSVVLRPNSMTAEEAFQLYDNLQGLSNATTTFSSDGVLQEGENFSCLTTFVNSAVIEQDLTIFSRNYHKQIEFNSTNNTVIETYEEA